MKTVLLVMTIGAALLGAPADAAEGDEAWAGETTCLVVVDPPEVWMLAVETTWVHTWPDHIDALNPGSTAIGAVPCIPTDCPEGWYLISGNVCSRLDPFAHLPVETEKLEPAAPTTTVAPGSSTTPTDPTTTVAPGSSTTPTDRQPDSVDVGDLVEPFTPTPNLKENHRG